MKAKRKAELYTRSALPLFNDYDAKGGCHCGVVISECLDEIGRLEDTIDHILTGVITAGGAELVYAIGCGIIEKGEL